jgi:5'-3' exonuclease
MGCQAATAVKVIFDFLRDETDGPAQLDVGQSSLAQIKNGLEADMEMLGNVLARPQVRILRRGYFLGDRRIPESAVI